ncbi:hypothetical protein KY363_04840 [Candidatus Woesearchaeota archaeon]|nr:hypothetical protein [Candidatus Woesearchaeota archaeon]
MKQKYPEGHFLNLYMGYGIVLGTGFGIPFGLAIGNLAFFGVGLPIGLAIGSAIGAAKEKEAKEAGLIRPLTNQEKKAKRLALYAGIGTLVFGVAVLLLFLLL